MEKKLSNKVWLSYGIKSGFGIGFDISRWYVTFDLGFWYIGLEF
jgi:hypothetical protein